MPQSESLESESNVIKIGGSTDAPYIAAGDESKYGDWLVYAMVYVNRVDLAAIAEKIRIIKYRFRLPVDSPLHCYQLFNKHQRKKKKISHINDEDAKSIIGLVTTILARHAFVRSGMTRLNDINARIGPALTLTSVIDGSTKQFPGTEDPKAHFSHLMMMCTVDVPGYETFPKAKDTEILLSEEKTKVDYFGSKRRADRLFDNFSEIGAPPGKVFQLDPAIVPANGHPLMELADVAAFIVAHAQDDKPWNSIFRTQLQRLARKYLPADVPPIPFLFQQPQ